MFRNHLISALRHLQQQRLYAVINIGGLALGLAACILILLFVRDELSYDDWIPDAERIFKIELTIPIPGRDTMKIGQVPPAIAPAMEEYFPDRIEDSTRVLQEDAIFGTGERYFKERISFVDADFFNVFDLEMVSGNRLGISNSTLHILISETLAIKYFGNSAAIGQVLSATLLNPYLESDPNIEFRVAGVFKDIPRNSHLPFQLLALIDPVRFQGINTGFGGAWLEAAYIKLFDSVDSIDLESRLC